MNSPITNDYFSTEPTHLHLTEQSIQIAHPGRAYHHHTHVIAVGHQLFAIFSSGIQNEDDVGQQVCFTTSNDQGQSWSAPRVIFSPPSGQFAQAVLTATGLFTYSPSVTAPAAAGETACLVAYFGQFEYLASGLEGGRRKPTDAQHANTACLASTSADGGVTWSEPGLILLGFVANISPQKLFSGRLVMPGGTLFPWTDYPTGLTGWQRSGLPGLPPKHVDDSAGYQRLIALDQARLGYCEGSLFQTSDSVLHMMLRTPYKHLAVTESRDDGRSWSPVMQTNFTDNTSRHQFGCLPDGRYFALSTPNPDPAWVRTPLVLALSRDGVHFDRHFILGDQPNHAPRHPGMHKGGRYGYPYLAIAGEWVVVVYTVAKEDIACLRFPLAALSD